MREKMMLIAILCALLTAIGGCFHVGREADLVSKLGLEHTVRIVVGVEERRGWNPAAFEITDPELVKSILSDLRKAVGVRNAKYEQIAAATFVSDKGQEVEVNIYGTRSGFAIALVGRQFYEFQGKLVEMILDHFRSS